MVKFFSKLYYLSMRNILIFIFVFNTIQTVSQNETDSIIRNMKEEVTYLSSDKLNGRKTGTKGEKKAAQYIRNKFKEKAKLVKNKTFSFN